MQALITLKRPAEAMALADEALQEKKMSQSEIASIQKLQLEAKAAAESPCIDKRAAISRKSFASSSDQQEDSKSSIKRIHNPSQDVSEACLMRDEESMQQGVEPGANSDKCRLTAMQIPDSKISLETTEYEGRHLVASRQIPQHERIFSSTLR